MAPVANAIDEGSGPTVLLVHGQPGAGSDWMALADILSYEFRVMAPDRPGWGASTDQARGIRENAAGLIELLEGFRVPAPVTVAGHSLGGGIAIEMALQRPDLIGALVLIGSVGVDIALTRFDRILARPAVGDPVIRVGIFATRRGLRTARQLARSSDTPILGPLTELVANRPTVRALRWLDAQPLTARDRRSFLIEQKALIDETPALEANLSRLHLPVAVVHGSTDRIVPESATRLLAERIPGAEHVNLFGEGHLVPFAKPSHVAEVITRFAKLGGARPAITSDPL